MRNSSGVIVNLIPFCSQLKFQAEFSFGTRNLTNGGYIFAKKKLIADIDFVQQMNPRRINSALQLLSRKWPFFFMITLQQRYYLHNQGYDSKFELFLEHKFPLFHCICLGNCTKYFSRRISMSIYFRTRVSFQPTAKNSTYLGLVILGKRAFSLFYDFVTSFHDVDRWYWLFIVGNKSTTIHTHLWLAFY